MLKVLHKSPGTTVHLVGAQTTARSYDQLS
jgi:hypothetical protein